MLALYAPKLLFPFPASSGGFGNCNFRAKTVAKTSTLADIDWWCKDAPSSYIPACSTTASCSVFNTRPASKIVPICHLNKKDIDAHFSWITQSQGRAQYVESETITPVIMGSEWKPTIKENSPCHHHSSFSVVQIIFSRPQRLSQCGKITLHFACEHLF